MNRADISQHTDSKRFLADAIKACRQADLDELLGRLPIVPPDEYWHFDPSASWIDGKLHWVPVGLQKSNMGRIQLANNPINPMAERAVNGMEALIELARARELAENPDAEPPMSPREAVMRYFGLPRLDQLDRTADKATWEKARELATHVRISIERQSRTKEFTLRVEDDGIGQPPNVIHNTLLSLSESTKDDKPYLIGLFGQGGSSTYAMCSHSLLLSRRPSDLVSPDEDGVGWSVVRQHTYSGRRGTFYLYLAATPDGEVPFVNHQAANELGFSHGTRFTHFDYDFAGMRSAVMMSVFPMLNHSLYNPVLPFQLETKQGRPDTVWGNAYRLSTRSRQGKLDADLTIEDQPVILT